MNNQNSVLCIPIHQGFDNDKNVHLEIFANLSEI